MDLLKVGIFAFMLGCALFHLFFTMGSAIREEYVWRYAHGLGAAALWFLSAFSSIPVICMILGANP